MLHGRVFEMYRLPFSDMETTTALERSVICFGFSHNLNGLKWFLRLCFKKAWSADDEEEEENGNMSFVVRKHVFGVFDQVRHKPGCTATD